MKSLEHPASLNAFEQYKQAAKILQTTSRATQSDWYQSALELDFQEHIFVDGPSVLTFFYQRSTNQWSVGSSLLESILTEPEQAEEFGLELIEKARGLNGKSMGVVLHIADEFSTAGLKPKYDNPGELSELRELVCHHPQEVLEDSSMPADQASWRLLPYPAAGSGTIATTISLSRRFDQFLTILRDLGNEENFPLVTQALCAPLVAIMDLPSMIHRKAEKPFVAVLQYPWFTAMAFFNEHSDLRLIRSIQHRGQSCPASFWSALATTNASLEFVNPDIFLLPLGAEIGSKVSENLRRNFPESSVKTVVFPQVHGLPSWAPELALSVAEAPEFDEKSQSHTFGALRTEGWFVQDFLSPSEEELAHFPSRNDMRLLRFFKFAKVALIAVVAIFFLWIGVSVIQFTRTEGWSFDGENSREVDQRLILLGQDNRRLEHWNSLLEDRSKGWSSMELVSRLFPADSGILLKNFNHTVRPDTGRGQAKLGFIREWNLSGMASEEAIDYLNSLNSVDGISLEFTEVARVTGDLSYDPAPKTRSLVVSLKSQENSKFRQRLTGDLNSLDDGAYPFTFTLSITQRFESTDVLALPTTKAP